jgi:hypothetical protein
MFKSLIMSLFPLGGSDSLTDIPSTSENTTKRIAYGISHIGDSSDTPCFEFRTESGTASIAIKLELESVIGALVIIVFNELDYVSHYRSLAFDNTDDPLFDYSNTSVGRFN